MFTKKLVIIFLIITSLLGGVRLGYFRAGTVVLNRGSGGGEPTWPLFKTTVLALK